MLTCANCHQSFCSSCKMFPYHKGFVCEKAIFEKCRFCDEDLRSAKSPVFVDCCGDEECVKTHADSCNYFNSCGHICSGVKNEKSHLPCLSSECCDDDSPSDQSECSICFDKLKISPVVRLPSCSHLFHYRCLKQTLDIKWGEGKIHFEFFKCPLCRQSFENLLQMGDQLTSLLRFRKQVYQMALNQLIQESRDQDETLSDPSSPFFQNVKPLPTPFSKRIAAVIVSNILHPFSFFEKKKERGIRTSHL